MRNCHHYIGELNEEIMLVKNRQQSYWSLLSGGVLWAFYSLGIRARVVVHGCAHFRGERGGDWLFYELKHGGGTLSPSNIKQEFIFSTYYILVLYHIFACSSTDQVRGSWRHWSWMIVAASVLYFHSILYIKPRYVHWGYKKKFIAREKPHLLQIIYSTMLYFSYLYGAPDDCDSTNRFAIEHFWEMALRKILKIKKTLMDISCVQKSLSWGDIWNSCSLKRSMENLLTNNTLTATWYMIGNWFSVSTKKINVGE